MLSESNPGWCPRGDHIARAQAHEVTDVRDQVGDVEDHRAGVAALEAMSVDLEPQLEILRIADFIRRHEPGADGGKGVAPFALVPLTSALELKRALGDVIDDAEACDMVQRLL